MIVSSVNVFCLRGYLQGEVWLYNISDQCSKNVLDQLNILRQQLGTRAGLLHHMLAQKIGLYRHCMGQDLREYSKVSPYIEFPKRYCLLPPACCKSLFHCSRCCEGY